MKRLILTLIFSLIVSLVSARTIGEASRLVYSVVDAAGGHVSGQTPTVKVQKVSTGDWMDFAEGAFKSSGWTAKTTVLSEDATNGYYFYQFVPPVTETTAEQYVFVVDNTDEIYADHQAVIVDYEAGSGLSANAVWSEPVAGLPAGSAGQLLSKINDATDGDREGGEYTGVEKMIRVNR